MDMPVPPFCELWSGTHLLQSWPLLPGAGCYSWHPPACGALPECSGAMGTQSYKSGERPTRAIPAVLPCIRCLHQDIRLLVGRAVPLCVSPIPVVELYKNDDFRLLTRGRVARCQADFGRCLGLKNSLSRPRGRTNLRTSLATDAKSRQNRAKRKTGKANPCSRPY